MFAALFNFIASHRIFVSRILAVAFFVLLIVTESATKGGIVGSLLLMAGLMLVGVGVVGRLWCSVYISGYKNAAVIATGPYSISRNPLYFFSFLGFIGIGLSTETFTFPLVMTLLFAIGYPLIIKREEVYLRTKFGSAFAVYAERTPRFLPRLKLLQEPESWSVNPRLFRRTMGDVVWFLWLVGIVQFIAALQDHRIVTPLWRVW